MIMIASASIGCVQRVPLTFHLTDADTSKPMVHVKVLATTRLDWIDQDVDLSPVDCIQAAVFKWTGQDQDAQGFTDVNGRVTLNAPFSHDGAEFSYGEQQAEFQIAGRNVNSPHSLAELESRTIEVALRKRPQPHRQMILTTQPTKD